MWVQQQQVRQVTSILLKAQCRLSTLTVVHLQCSG
jgi:hypothetical protein